MSENLLVLGSSGLLGQMICNIMEESGKHFYPHTRIFGSQYQADLHDIDSINALLLKTNPSIIYNFVALADVDECEVPNKAYLGNVRTVENIIKSIEPSASLPFLLNISTDHVYDSAGFSKESEVTLSNYYSFSKYAGEIRTSSYQNGCSLRTNFFGKSPSLKNISFTDWLYQSISSGDKLNVFNDVYFNPLSVSSLEMVFEKVTLMKIKGIYNVGSKTGMSKSEFAFYFAEELGLPTKNIDSVSIHDVNFIKTYRPKDMRMDVCKIEDSLNLKMPTLADEIKKVAREYR